MNDDKRPLLNYEPQLPRRRFDPEVAGLAVVVIMLLVAVVSFLSVIALLAGY